MSMIKNYGKEKLEKLVLAPVNRRCTRGFKKCPSCGEINGQRTLVCRNVACTLRQTILATRRPFDPVQLISLNQTAIYSVRRKENDVQQRNFVEITEETLAIESAKSAIVSRKAICLADICKYDASQSTGIFCNHINACLKNNLPQAQAYNVAREVLWNLNIPHEQKQQLWQLYVEDEKCVPPVQRLNDTCFAVKCTPSQMFLTGRLHVTAQSNNDHIRKRGTQYACSCKKLKIIVEPDNSVVMQKEICDHLLLVLAAILSQPDGKNVYKNFINALKSYWMPATLEPPIVDTRQPSEDFLGLDDINLGGNFGHGGVPLDSDIFIFGNDNFMPDDVVTNIPDFSDIIMELSHERLATISTATTTSTNNTTTLINPSIMENQFSYIGNPDLPLNGQQTSTLQENTAVGEEGQTFNCDVDALNYDIGCETQLELSDCNIELMDQFDQLTDQIDLCSDDIELPSDLDYFCPLPANENKSLLKSNNPQHQQLLPAFNMSPMVVATTTDANAQTTIASAMSPPPIELPTIAVVKPSTAVRAKDVVHEVKTRKYPHIPAKRKLISNCKEQDINKNQDEELVTADTEPSLAFSAWLEYVVETINESVQIHEKRNVDHQFHVHEEIFAHFSKTFSIGVKRRVPNRTTLMKEGRHRGLIKYVWYFSTESTVKRIFSNKNISIETERNFECSKDGSFISYVRKPDISPSTKSNTKIKRIYPKLELYKAYISFDCVMDVNRVCGQQSSGLKVEWIPNAFPKSHFGVMNIGFSLGFKEPQKLPSKI